MIQDIRDAAMLGDKGYDSDDFRDTIRQQNHEPVIPGKSNRIVSIDYDKALYKARHLIENFFAKIKNFRRIFSQFDKSMRNYASLWLLREQYYGYDKNSTARLFYKIKILCFFIKLLQISL